MGSVALNSEVKMPKLGYGAYQVDPVGCERCVLDDISVGCRSIGTAQAYNNEEDGARACPPPTTPRPRWSS